MKKILPIISGLFFFGIFQNRLIAQIAKADTIAWGESVSVLLGNKIGYRGLLMSQNKEITALQLENGERVQFRTESIVRQRILKAKITNVRAFAGNPSTEKPRIFGGALNKIVMLDGSQYIGLIRKKDTLRMWFEMRTGKIINIPIVDIESVQIDYYTK